ncbi:uncharacterized protein LOC144678964 [Cetorhinus maximus]
MAVQNHLLQQKYQVHESLEFHTSEDSETVPLSETMTSVSSANRPTLSSSHCLSSIHILICSQEDSTSCEEVEISNPEDPSLQMEQKPTSNSGGKNVCVRAFRSLVQALSHARGSFTFHTHLNVQSILNAACWGSLSVVHQS